jgi:hypothetical protein
MLELEFGRGTWNQALELGRKPLVDIPSLLVAVAIVTFSHCSKAGTFNLSVEGRPPTAGRPERS